jgi:xanthine dehydrogenase accessory factor
MTDWASRALAALAQGEPAVLVSVLAIEGSAPREAGARMVVTEEGSVGSIGGGNLEFQAIGQARKALQQDPGDWRIQDYPLGPFLQQCCGGRVRLLIERLDDTQTDWIAAVREPGRHHLETILQPGRLDRRILEAPCQSPIGARGPVPQPGERILEVFGDPLTPLLLFGAGHVGRAIARVLEGLPFALAWHDEREGSDRAEMIELAKRADGAVLILTHDHALDYLLTTAALSGPARFIGLIGSGTKRARFRRRLAADGFDETALDRVVCPIGLPGISGKAPEVIAVAVAAQLLTLTFSPRT